MFFIKPIKRSFSQDKELFTSLKQILGFYPENIAVYKTAFRHKSLRQKDVSEVGEENIITDNERLEYLGDAVLGAVVAYYLFKKFPYKSEGFLTEMRSKIVSREHLNKLAIKIGLDKFVDVGSNTVSKSIFGNVFEAFIGAIYIDRSYKYAEEFILNKIIKYHIDIEKLQEKEVNYKGKLIDWAQKEKKDFEFEVVKERGRGRDKRYYIQVLIDNKSIGEGVGFTKKTAEQRAAEQACNVLGID